MPAVTCKQFIGQKTGIGNCLFGAQFADGYLAGLWQSACDTGGGIRGEIIIRQLHREAEKDGHVFAAPTGPFVFLGSMPAGNIPEEDFPVQIRRGPVTNSLDA